MFIKKGVYRLLLNDICYKNMYFDSEVELEKYIDELNLHNSESFNNVIAEFIN